MTDVIQHNAANMLAISLLFFSSAVSAQANKPAICISGPIKQTSPLTQSNCSTASMLLPD
jgi:hypothetical protein